MEATSAAPSSTTPVAQRIPSQQQIMLASLMRAVGVNPAQIKSQGSVGPQQDHAQTAQPVDRRSTKQKVEEWNTKQGYSTEVPAYHQTHGFNNEMAGAGPEWFEWSKLPGHEEFYSFQPEQNDVSSVTKLDGEKQAAWLERNKYSLAEEQLGNGWSRRWIFDEKGEPVVAPKLVQPADDRAFWNAATLVAGAFAGPAISTAAGGGALGAAAASASMAGALTYAETGSLTDSLKAAAISAGPSFLTFVPGYTALPAVARNAIGGAVSSALRGGSMNQALRSALVSAVNSGRYTQNPAVNRMLGQMLGQQIIRKTGGPG